MDYYHCSDLAAVAWHAAPDPMSFWASVLGAKLPSMPPFRNIRYTDEWKAREERALKLHQRKLKMWAKIDAAIDSYEAE